MSDAGICAIKPEFVISDHIKEVTLECVSKKDKQKLIAENSEPDPPNESLEPPYKKKRLSKSEKKKLRGQNKSRPAPFRVDRQSQLCNSLLDVAENEEVKKCSNERCVYLHNPEEYLKIKPKDIGDYCYNFDTIGRCPRGITCRFGANHITSNGYNKINEEKYNAFKNKTPSTVNQLSYELIISLRKRTYDFSLTDKTVAAYDERRKNKQDNKTKENSQNTNKDIDIKTGDTDIKTEDIDIKNKDTVINTEDIDTKIKDTDIKTEDIDIKIAVTDETNDGTEKTNGDTDKTTGKTNDDTDKTNDNIQNGEKEIKKTAGTVTDEDIIKIRKPEKKTIDWNDKLYLSPLTTVGNLPFRRICKEYGADITCGEMAMCISLLRGMNPEWALVKRHESENIFGVQICGNNPHITCKTAQMLQEKCEIDFVDINLGCPIDLVYKEGAGCGLLRRTNVLNSVIQCTSDILNIPLTVKTRTGVYSNQNIAHTLVPKFKEWGASMITLHGRSREQRYTKSADWNYINECASLAAPIPLFGNGDILSYEDYTSMRENYKNVSGVMIGRGALVKPWIFTEIKEQRLWDISSKDRFDILKKYVNYGLEHWGSDTKGVENTRRFMLEWLSFLYRYVPVGILERPPQKINERPPTYHGRDDLETLMASASCTDWIKISEMLLGPVPENFHFLPKHKANSYK